jgi:hypothetical protein
VHFLWGAVLGYVAAAPALALARLVFRP